MNVSVIGGGAWGTAFADHLARLGHSVRLWVREPDIASAINNRHENHSFLKGIPLHARLAATDRLDQAASGAELAVIAVPSRFCRDVLTQIKPHLDSEAALVSLTKGLDRDTLKLPTQLIEEIMADGRRRVAAISGPSFADEVARQKPTAVVLALDDQTAAVELQKNLSSPTFRVYTSPDVVGVQLGGALKNVIAVAAGVSDGLGLGHNARAALIARGLAEITRLGRALGADPATFAGLSGLGDLVLTCTGDLSRNRKVGMRIAHGESLSAIQAAMHAVAEGVETTQSAVALARRHGVRVPIFAAVHAVLFESKDARRAVTELLEIPPADKG